jgi:hypothetical protein
MSGILRRIRPHGYETGLDRFCLMSFRTVATSSLSMACQLMIRRSYVLASQTGIECQPDTLRGGGKSYTHIRHVAVLTWPCAEGGRGRRRSKVPRRARLRPWRVCSRERGLLLAEHTRLTHVGSRSLPLSRIPECRAIGSSPYSPGLCPG